MNLKHVLDFFYELGHLKKIPRSGWPHLGIKNPESDADHVMRAAQIAYTLAVMEGHPNPCEVCTIVVFHEIDETRGGDQNAVTKKYVTVDRKRIVRDETTALGELGNKIAALWQECEDHQTSSGKIAKDADILECMMTARELMEQGHDDAVLWIKSNQIKLETASAKMLGEELLKTDPHEWWKNLK